MAEINTTCSRQAPQFTAQAVPCAVSKVFLVKYNSQSKLNMSESVNVVKDYKGEETLGAPSTDWKQQSNNGLTNYRLSFKDFQPSWRCSQ